MFDIAYCTYFDSNYFSRGLALHQSLVRHCNRFRLYVMALDELSWKWLVALNLVNTCVLHLDHIMDDELEAAQANREWDEFIWTCTAPFIWYCRKKFNAQRLVYLDADTYFFSNPSPLFQELKPKTGHRIVGDYGTDIGITPHRFPPELAWRVLKNGIYNLGIIYFDNSGVSYQALQEWRKQCLEWCGRTYKDPQHKCGDQGYLDDWPEKYGTHEIQHPGVNLGPWNQMQYTYVEHEGVLYIYHDFHLRPVILYHFHAWGPKRESGYPLHPLVKSVLYPEYVRVIAEKEAIVKELRQA